MILIRPEKPEDYNYVNEVNKQAFGQEDEACLVERIRKSPNYIKELSLIAVKNNKIVGHILFSIIRINTKKGPIPVLSLAPMAVLPEFQKQGIGSLLVRKGLEKSKRLGYKTVILIGHPDYYPRFGFTGAKGKGLKAPFPVPDEAFLVYELVPGSLDGINGTIEYPDLYPLLYPALYPSWYESIELILLTS